VLESSQPEKKAIANFLDKKATFAGSSIHFLTLNFDFGPVLGRTFEKIESNDNVESLYARLKKKDDVKEIYEDQEKLKKIIQGYDWLSSKFTKEIIAVNGEGPVDKVTQEIYSKIKL